MLTVSILRNSRRQAFAESRTITSVEAAFLANDETSVFEITSAHPLKNVVLTPEEFLEAVLSSE